MREDEFWHCTPKKLQGLFHVLKSETGSEENESIDDIIF